MKMITKDDIDTWQNVLKEYRKTATVFAVQVHEPFSVATMEGVMRAEMGDYICQANTAEGEIWPVKRAIFEKTYGKVKAVMKCGWIENEDGAWKTGCGNVFEFSNHEGPSGNGQKYCGYCGKPIGEVRCWSDSDE